MRLAASVNIYWVQIAGFRLRVVYMLKSQVHAFGCGRLVVSCRYILSLNVVKTSKLQLVQVEDLD